MSTEGYWVDDTGFWRYGDQRLSGIIERLKARRPNPGDLEIWRGWITHLIMHDQTNGTPLSTYYWAAGQPSP